MGKTEEYILSGYKQCGTLDKSGRVSLVFSETEKRVYVKKIVDKSVGELYLRLKKIDGDAFPKIKESVDMGEYCVVIEEYIAGSTLRQRIEERGAMDAQTASGCIYEVLKAVSILHQNGIVHRDITENNVMLTDSGKVKIIDFNISHSNDSTKTKDTVVMGTSGYAAPEQFGFFRSDERTDIYSVGVLYNYMLTGSTELGGYMGDAKAEKIIGKCTEFSPEKRYKSCDEVMAVLDGRSRFKMQKPLSKAFIAVLVIEAILIVGSIGDIVHGKGLYKGLAMIVDSAVLLVLPFVLIGDYFGWQERLKMDKLPQEVRRVISVILYIFIVGFMAEVVGSPK